MTRHKPNYRKILMRLSEGIAGGIGTAILGAHGHFEQISKSDYLAAAAVGLIVSARSLWTNPKDEVTQTPIAPEANP